MNPEDYNEWAAVGSVMNNSDIDSSMIIDPSMAANGEIFMNRQKSQADANVKPLTLASQESQIVASNNVDTRVLKNLPSHVSFHS